MICCLVSDAVPKPGALAEVARACSPRIESHGDRVVVFDAGGLERVIGPPAHIAREVGALAAEQGFIVRIALAPTMAAAWLMAHAQIGQTVVDAPRMRGMLGALPLASLATLPGAHGPKKRVFDLPAGQPRLTVEPVGVQGVWVNGISLQGGERPGKLLRDFAA